jgi:hypothetical protein
MFLKGNRGIFASLALSLPALTFGQTASDVIFTIDLDNVVAYYDDGSGPAKTASSTSIVNLPTDFVFAFRPYFWLGDVVAVNGKPAKGTLFMPGVAVNASSAPAPVPKRPITDASRNQVFQFQIEILGADGAEVGTLAVLGLGSGPPPPGSPRTVAAGNFSIVGGSGAFAGAGGDGATVSSSNLRNASVMEDPAYRRVNGGGKWRIAFRLIRVPQPEIVAAYHADFTRISEASPARSGETLILAVRGMGPTRPARNPGETFAGDPLQLVAAPVDVAANDQAAAVVNQVGWPETQDIYRVDVILPAGLRPGSVNLVLSVAWMPSAEFRIQVK